YFKEKAIPWAYEFITGPLGFDPDRLWYTVHDNDDEAAEIWIDGVGIPPDRLQRRGDADNFWQMGVAGPAGHASEIFYDRGPEFGPEGGPVVDEERFTEFWNLVFMQFVQDVPYHVVGDLPATGIDTGAGLDRVAVLLQGVANLFEIDVVRPILTEAENATGVTYGTHTTADVSLRILADHGRAITFLIGDGVVPSNEGRGYVLRRLLRRTVRHAWQLGSTDRVTPRLIGASIDTMGGAYPSLVDAREGIIEMAEREEARFRRTLDSGHSLLDEALDSLDAGQQVPGETAFKLHDTFGFPVELTEEIAAERGHGVDLTGFESEMEAQRRRARAARKSGVSEDAAPAYRAVYEEAGPSEFIGYEYLTGTGRVLAIVREGEMIERAADGETVEVFLDRTPFYAEAGGQVGDTGTIVTETGALRIEDTRFPVQGLNGHSAVVTSGSVAVGQDATLEVDADRRERIRKCHTGTHILHWALRDVLGPHVQQAGSLVEAGRFRFDFSHFTSVDIDELDGVEATANGRVVENAAVRTFEVSRQDAEDLGALAFFGDKYGDKVRVVDAGGYSRELCGGTHVPTTGQIGPLIVLGEASIGSNLRRIEALTGATAYRHMSDLRHELRTAAGALRTRHDSVASAAVSLVERSRELEEKIEAFEAQSRTSVAADLAEAAEKVGDSHLVVATQSGVSPDELRTIALQVRDRIGSGIVVLGGDRDGKAGLIAAVSKDLVGTGVSAADVLLPAARLVGGGGSRDPELSQAGGPHGDRLDEALEEARSGALSVLRGA
ncbi:alanine--tRNA ligase, partial [bacterium]|nr:alanine--tRNA ligase [bacterium]